MSNIGQQGEFNSQHGESSNNYDDNGNFNYVFPGDSYSTQQGFGSQLGNGDSRPNILNNAYGVGSWGAQVVQGLGNSELLGSLGLNGLTGTVGGQPFRDFNNGQFINNEINPAMNNGMNPGMYNSINYGMNPNMNNGINYGINPGMNNGINPGLTPVMTPGMYNGNNNGLNYNMNPAMNNGINHGMNQGVNGYFNNGQRMNPSGHSMNHNMGQGMNPTGRYPNYSSQNGGVFGDNMFRDMCENFFGKGSNCFGF